MNFLLAPSALLLLANTAGAEIPGMRAKLQAILNNRSAGLDRRFRGARGGRASHHPDAHAVWPQFFRDVLNRKIEIRRRARKSI